MPGQLLVLLFQSGNSECSGLFVSLTPLKLGISFFVSSHTSSSKISLKFGMWPLFPRKLLTPVIVVDGLAFLIMSTFYGSGETPCPKNTNSKNVMLFLLNSLFLLFRIRLTSVKFCNTARSFFNWQL